MNRATSANPQTWQEFPNCLIGRNLRPLYLDGYGLASYLKILGEVYEEIFPVVVSGIHLLDDALMILQECPRRVDGSSLGLLRG